MVATVAIFLPSFFYVAALGPILPKLRSSAWMAAFLDSVNACAIALMVGVMVRLAGVQGITSIRFSADGKSYTYSVGRILSDLYVVDGLK